MEIARYLSVGVINSLIGYAIIFFSMYVVGLSPVASNVVGYSVGLLIAYILHRDFTFRVAKHQRMRFIKFLATFLLAYTANLVVLVILVDQLMIHKALSQIVAGGVYIAVSFLLSKHVVFKTRSQS